LAAIGVFSSAVHAKAGEAADGQHQVGGAEDEQRGQHVAPFAINLSSVVTTSLTPPSE
jgi:hypothetical protein